MSSTSVFPSRRLNFGGVLIAVLGFQLFHLYGLHASKDLPLWDESAYIGWGDEFLQDGKVGSITNAPAYHLLYAAIIRLVGVLPSFHVSQYLLKLTLSALFFLLCFRFSRSIALSALLGVFLACSYFHLNIDVLVYYGALIPFIGAILVARRAPLLSLGLSFLAGLVRLEYMAVPLVHAVFLVWQRVSQAREQASGRSWLARIGGYSAAAAVWGFNIWTLTCITVWQFHNRVWFAWSQNYAFFRYLTGRDAGGNPWLDHQSIAERDFPGAHSLSEALAANPTAVLEHTWFNLHKLPGYLAQFIVVHQHAGWWRNAPVVVVLLLLGAGAIALVARRPRRDRIVHWLRAHDVEIALCLAGVISAAPGGIVSSKTNYIMALVPAAVGVIAVAHRLAIRSTAGGRWLPRVYGTLTVGFAAASFLMQPAYSSRAQPGPVFQDATAMRTLLAPFNGLKILGVSTASYVNYLGREHAHKFIEPLAISPVNPQATDLSLAGLIRQHDPDVLLINSHWRSSASYETAMHGSNLEAWERHELRDGALYLRAGLLLQPVFGEGWFSEEQLGNLTWRWSRGDASIHLSNPFERPVVLRFKMRSLAPRRVRILLNRTPVAETTLQADRHQEVEIILPRLPAGRNELFFDTDEPPTQPSGGDERLLAFSVEDWTVDYRHRPDR